MKCQDTRSISSWGLKYYRYANFFLCGVPLNLLEPQELFHVVSVPSVGGEQKNLISLRIKVCSLQVSLYFQPTMFFPGLRSSHTKSVFPHLLR